MLKYKGRFFTTTPSGKNLLYQEVTMKKLWKSTLLFLLVPVFLLTGCTGNNDTQATTTPTPEPVDTASPELTPEPSLELELSPPDTISIPSMQRVGNDSHGFFDIPYDWLPFVELDPHPDDNMIQFSDTSGSDIITVRYMLAADVLPPDQMLSNIAGHWENSGAVDVYGARVSLNGIEALQIYAFWPALGTQTVTWAFERDDIIHVVTAEGPIENIFQTVSFLEASFSFDPAE